jgi:acetyl-CoA acetyltransferase
MREVVFVDGCRSAFGNLGGGLRKLRGTEIAAEVVAELVRRTKILEKGTMCKMARGEMVRYMAEHQIKNPEDIKQFQRLDYSFDAAKSTDETFVFVRKGAKECSLD